MIQVLFQNADFTVIHKPAGWHVHPPENPLHWAPKDRILVSHLKKQLSEKVYPVHRLDVGTSGVMVFARHSVGASRLNSVLRQGGFQKTYHAVVRGWVEAQGEINLDLPLDSTGDLVKACTLFKKLSQIELNQAVGKRHSTARYSLVQVHPLTGRFHQIRRHFARLSHPVLVDAVHGDSHHNRFFREKLGIPSLCLKSYALSFEWEGERRIFCAPIDLMWTQIYSLFGISDLDFNS